MIQVHIEHDWRTRLVKVWLYDRSMQGVTVFHFTPEGQRIATFQDNQSMLLQEPSLVLEPEWLQALVEEAKDLTPPSQATQEHLKDAMQVRDRLLALVEKQR